MDSKKSPEISSKFFCELCHYKCCKQSEYTKHISTAKHQKLENASNNASELAPNLRPNSNVIVVKYIITILVIIGIGGNVSNNQVLTVIIWYLIRTYFFFLLKRIVN